MEIPIINHAHLHREFPECPRSIDSKLLEPYERQALKNHGQTLKRLAERGGLSPQEIYAIVNEVRLEMFPNKEAVKFLIYFNRPID